MKQLLLAIDWNIFNHEYMGEKVSNYLWCILIIVATVALKKPVAGLLTRMSSRIAAKFSYLEHRSAVRNMLFKPVERLLQVILYFVALNQLGNLLDRVRLHHAIGKNVKLDIRLDDIADHIFLFLFIICLAQVVAGFIDFIYYLRLGKAKIDNNHARVQLLPLIKEMAKLVLWAASAFWILGAVFHVNIPALITGLGIGGVAIALAGKETVENFFAAFTILSDKPFQQGETIKLGDIEGVVERIGFRSTRLRNADGSAYIIPNQNLVSQNLVNLSLRNNRLIKVVANIKYGINPDDLKKLIAALKETLKNTEHVIDPVDATIEIFDKETFQLVISYHLPHPLPPNVQLGAVKREINMKIFTAIAQYGTLGIQAGTGG